MGKLFEKAGAKYIVLTSKHHDGLHYGPMQQQIKHGAFHGMQELWAIKEIC